MKIKSFNHDTEYGFAWIIVEGGPYADSPDMTVQCCLREIAANPEFGQKQEFLAEIICGDCGHNWGICGDVNEPAFKYWGENRCMKALFKSAKKHGLNVIGL